MTNCIVALGRKENYLKIVRIASITRSKIQDDFFEIEIHLIWTNFIVYQDFKENEDKAQDIIIEINISHLQNVWLEESSQIFIIFSNVKL